MAGDTEIRDLDLEKIEKSAYEGAISNAGAPVYRRIKAQTLFSGKTQSTRFGPEDQREQEERRDKYQF